MNKKWTLLGRNYIFINRNGSSNRVGYDSILAGCKAPVESEVANVSKIQA
jgi:hypothetical protein